jgi:hypothetical protein
LPERTWFPALKMQTNKNAQVSPGIFVFVC